MSETSHVQVVDHAVVLIAVLRCEKVGARESQIVETELKAAAPKRHWRMVIDLSQVTMLASMGLGMLVTMHKQCNAAGGKLAICGMNGELNNLIKITHLERVLRIVADQPSAIKAVS